MITAQPRTWKNTRALVVGLGLHGGGEATVRWLAKHGAQVRVTDSKTAAQLKPTLQKLKKIRGVVYHLGEHQPADFRWAEIIVLNPGVSPDHPLVKSAKRQGVTIVNEATIFFEACPAPIVGVTGTRGKTTTTLLIGDMVKAAKRQVVVSGNVRQVAMLGHVDQIKPAQTVVLELSSFQLELMPAVKRSPQVAVITNVKVDHLSRHRTVLNYANIKFQILRYQTSQDVAVLNGENPWTRRAADLTKAQVIWFSRRRAIGEWSVFPNRGWIVEKKNRQQTRLVPLSAWYLPGTHQLENLLAAVAVARALALPLTAVTAAVRSFTGVPHRQEKIRTWRGHAFINDTTATSPDGSLAAFEVWPQGVFILGGTDKLLDFRGMAKILASRNIPAVFLPGTGTEKLLSGLRGSGYRAPHRFATSMEQAVHQAVDLAKLKQPIILSPGAASFGLFVHEFDRGDQFVKVVKQLR